MFISLYIFKLWHGHACALKTFANLLTSICMQKYYFFYKYSMQILKMLHIWDDFCDRFKEMGKHLVKQIPTTLCDWE